MSLKEWKNNEINTKLMKKWGLLTEAKEAPPEELTEASKEEESEHYGEDESSDKHEEDRLEDHLDAIEHHLKRLRDDMGFDQHREDDHMDEGGMNYRKEDEPADDRRGDDELDSQETGVNETVSKKLSVKEAKELAHRLIERIRKEGK